MNVRRLAIVWLGLCAWVGSQNPAAADKVIPFSPPASEVSAEHWAPRTSGDTYYDKYTFDAWYKGGGSFYFSVLNSNMMVKREELDVQSRITLPDGRELRTKQELKKGQWSSETKSNDINMKMGNHSIVGTTRKWTIAIKGEGYEAEVTFEAAAPPWRPLNGRAYFGSDKKLYFDMTLLSPRALVTATVKVGSETITLTGDGYGSHAQSNVEPHRQAKRLLSFRAISGEWSIWFKEFVTPSLFGEARVPWLLITKGRHILFQSFDYAIDAKEWKTDEKHPNQYRMPVSFVVTAKSGADELKMAVKVRKLNARKDQLERLSKIERAIVSKFAQPVVYEMDADYSLELTAGGKPLTKKGTKARYEVECLAK